MSLWFLSNITVNCQGRLTFGLLLYKMQRCGLGANDAATKSFPPSAEPLRALATRLSFLIKKVSFLLFVCPGSERLCCDVITRLTLASRQNTKWLCMCAYKER